MFSVTTHLIDTGRCAEKVRKKKRPKKKGKKSDAALRAQEDAQEDLKTAKEFLKCLAGWMPRKCLAFNTPVGAAAILAEEGAAAQWKHADVEAGDYIPDATCHLQHWRPIAGLMPLGESAQFIDCLIGSHLVTQV
jgi:hypothetical protein